MKVLYTTDAVAAATWYCSIMSFSTAAAALPYHIFMVALLVLLLHWSHLEQNSVSLHNLNIPPISFHHKKSSLVFPSSSIRSSVLQTLLSFMLELMSLWKYSIPHQHKIITSSWVFFFFSIIKAQGVHKNRKLQKGRSQSLEQANTKPGKGIPGKSPKQFQLLFVSTSR